MGIRISCDRCGSYFPKPNDGTNLCPRCKERLKSPEDKYVWYIVLIIVISAIIITSYETYSKSKKIDSLVVGKRYILIDGDPFEHNVTIIGIQNGWILFRTNNGQYSKRDSEFIKMFDLKDGDLNEKK